MRNPQPIHRYIKLGEDWYCEVSDKKHPEMPRYIWNGKQMKKEEENGAG